jgi:23S rRNA (cytosine1962-C5)-methyltransferase
LPSYVDSGAGRVQSERDSCWKGSTPGSVQLDLLHAASVAPAIERGLEPDREEPLGEGGVRCLSPQGEDVRVVVLARQTSRLLVIGEGRANALVAIRHHGHALTCRADEYAPLGLAPADCVRHAVGEVRVVHRCVRGWAHVLEWNAHAHEGGLEPLLERKPRVVGGNENGFHRHGRFASGQYILSPGLATAAASWGHLGMGGLTVEGRVRVSRRGEERIRRGHLWVFRSDVERADNLTPGAAVAVEVHGGRQIGFAWYSDASEIQLRILTREAALDKDLLAHRLDAALAWRERVAEGAGACRLVHGEGDQLPSVVVDRYGDVVVIQTLCQGADRNKDALVSLLAERLAPRAIVERNDPRVRQFEGLEQRKGILQGEIQEPIEVEEGGLRLRVDVLAGQKTGLFLDQRENHAAARAYARGRVFDAFSYEGGFALQAARSATEVLAVDASADAVARIQANAALNGLANITAREANAFDVLREAHDSGDRYDTVILDPPAFAKSKGAVEKAVRGYKEINLRALRILRPGGFLITCSCSYHVHEAEFEAILSSAAADSGATVTLVERRRQGRDHPVLLAMPETYYLKCFILRRLS